MTDIDKAVATHLTYILKQTGKSLAECIAVAKGSGLNLV